MQVVTFAARTFIYSHVSICPLPPLSTQVGGQVLFAGDWDFYQPLQGGARFIVFQALGWAFFGISIIFSTAPWALAVMYPKLIVQVAMRSTLNFPREIEAFS